MHSLCLIVPCYNEAERLDLPAFADALRQREHLRLVFVNDGSTDHTLERLQSFCADGPRRHVLDQQPNAGKAAAVRAGILYALDTFSDTSYFGYWDADLATPFAELEWFAHVDGGNLSHLFLVGSRFCRLGAQVSRNPIRHYVGRIFATLASEMLGLPVYDTQCGAKLIHASWTRDAFEQPFSSRWLFDVEIFARLIAKHGRDVVHSQSLEVPLRVWSDVHGSKVRASDAFRIPLQLLKIKRRYHL